MTRDQCSALGPGKRLVPGAGIVALVCTVLTQGKQNLTNAKAGWQVSSVCCIVADSVESAVHLPCTPVSLLLVAWYNAGLEF